jgi:UrcA family protein
MQASYLAIFAVAVLSATPSFAGPSGDERGVDPEPLQQIIYVNASDAADTDRQSVLRRKVHAAARTVCRNERYSAELERACIRGTAEHTLAELKRAAVRMATGSNQFRKISTIVRVR